MTAVRYVITLVSQQSLEPKAAALSKPSFFSLQLTSQLEGA